jgi:hypothetical protein
MVGSQRGEIGEKVFSSFEEYFPHYVSQHSRPATRWLHFAGAHLGAVAAAAALVRRQPAGILALPLIGYWVARGSHLAVEKNRPATFAHPLWSLRGDLRMIAMMWQGRDDELTRIARDQCTIVLDGGEPGSA